jgi:hypothetical protein
VDLYAVRLVVGISNIGRERPVCSYSSKRCRKSSRLDDGRRKHTRQNGALHDQAGQNDKADNTTRDLCNAIKDENITVYTIAYEVTNGATKSLLRDCATTRSFYFNARNASELNKAFEDIANSLTELRISA